MAIEKRADLKASKSKLDGAEWNVGVARSGYLPKLDLNLSVFQAGRGLSEQVVNGTNILPFAQDSPWSQLGEHTYYVAGITLTWNIFDRFLTNENISHAHVDVDNARLDFEDNRLRIQGEIRKVLGDYRSAVQELDTSRVGLQSAQEAYDAVKGRYEVGASSFVDLITAQSALVQAQTARVQAQIDFILQKKLVEFYRGDTPVDED